MEWMPSPASGDKFALLSLRNFPKESDLATMYSAYFISYLICDLGLGIIYYRPYLDPLSGWLHHIGYLAIISNATLQKNVSTFFAMGTPIEASGHIFPKLRSDILFAIAFFTSRIVYPIVLLPELYLNVESQLCWKVALMALLLHVHWFRKFVQQQIRYYHARKNSCSQSEPHSSASQVISKKIDERPENNTESLEANVVPLMSVTNKAVIEQVKISHNQVKPLRRTPSPSFDSSIDRESEPIPSVTGNVSEAPAKTMRQLLEECEQEDFSYAMPIQGIKGSGNNKTFSPEVLKRLISIQDPDSLSSRGALRLSRASSMRDSKRRIALDDVKFENPKAIRPKSMMFDTPAQQLEGNATVVFRQRPSRSSAAMLSLVEKNQGLDYDMGTIRASQRISAQA
ncbi:hypothetical protein BGZ46_009264 [Entomortierella lignicola]|nr:hypothetical protein BGZ46_009264 [Entomortierella lignicola]